MQICVYVDGGIRMRYVYQCAIRYDTGEIIQDVK